MKTKVLQFYLDNVKPYSDKIPYFRELARIIWRFVWKLILTSKSIWLSIDLEKIYWINPKKIEYSLDENWCYLPKNSTCADNDKKNVHNWDLSGKLIKFKERESYKGFYQHFIEGKKWPETIFYQSVLNQMERGMFKWGCSSEKEFIERCRQLDELYKDIKNNGFKTQKMLGNEEKLKHRGIREVSDEISVIVGRDGNLIHYDGQNRLAIAKILNLNQVPVKIYQRHKKWLKFRKKLFQYVKKEMLGRALEPILHPDFVDIPSIWGNKRFEIIKKNIKIENGKLLDVSAHWGFFCHKFEEMGFQCTAMDDSMKNIYFMKKIKCAERLNFNIISKSIFDYKDYEDFEDDLCFDVVLALNLFNQIIDIEEKNLCSKFVEIFGKIKAKEMYFQVPENGSMEKIRKTNKYKNGIISSQKLIDNIIKNTYFTYAEKIGEERNHGIYKLC